MTTTRLKYLSRKRAKLTDAELLGVLETSQRNNTAASICGVLMYSEHSFFQLLEGPTEAIEALWSRICSDGRHHSIQLLERSVGDQAPTLQGFAMQELRATVPGVPSLEAIGALLDSAARCSPEAVSADLPQESPGDSVVQGEVAAQLCEVLTQVAQLVHKAFAIRRLPQTDAPGAVKRRGR